jgi:hypothetical protein
MVRKRWKRREVMVIIMRYKVFQKEVLRIDD